MKEPSKVVHIGINLDPK
jgi:hypothetical protein